MSGFRHLYLMAQSGRIYGTDTLPNLLAFNQWVLAVAPAPGGAIPVAVQYLSYARLRPDAEAAGLVTLQNEQLYDVPGRHLAPAPPVPNPNAKPRLQAQPGLCVGVAGCYACSYRPSSTLAATARRATVR